MSKTKIALYSIVSFVAIVLVLGLVNSATKNSSAVIS